MCAAVLSVASRVPPTPIDQDAIPGIQIGSATDGGVTPALRSRASSPRRDPARGSDSSGSGGDSRERRRAAVPVAYGNAGGERQTAVAAPRSGDGLPDQPVSGTGPAGGDGPGPGARDDDRDGDGRQLPGAGGREGAGKDDDDEATAPRERAAPAPAPAPAPGPPAGGDEDAGEGDDDGAPPAPTGTAARDDDDGEAEVGERARAGCRYPCTHAGRL